MGASAGWGAGGFTYVHPRNNLAQCFHCNNILDLLVTLGYDIHTAVNILESWLQRHQAWLPKTRTTPMAE